MSKKILFFGNERLATGVTSNVPVLRALIDAGYGVAAVVVAQNPADKSRQARQLEVAAVAEACGIPLISPADLTGAAKDLAAYGAEAAVLVAYGKLVPKAIIDLFPGGIINVHPSLLPLHRGSTPLESVILDGSIETAVSLMRLGEKMDAGPVYAQQPLSLSGRETKQELADKLSLLGSELVIKHLPAILDGSLQPTPQDESKATYDKLIVKSDGELDWTKPAVQLGLEVRAYAGWPRSRTKLGSTEVVITKAHTTAGKGEPGQLWIENKQVGVYSADGILVIDSLIPAGKKEMAPEAFLAGYKPN